MNEELRSAIAKHAQRIGANPVDLANVISYETGGTFDPWQKGPTTKWGQHEGFIQMGEPQRQKYGYTPGKSVDELVGASADYLVGSGYKSGMGLLDMYSIVNAGSPGHYTAMDNGTTVAQKVENMMGAHRAKAADLMGPGFSTASTNYTPVMPTQQSTSVDAPTNISPGIKASPVDTTMVFQNMPAQPYTQREQYVRDTMEVNDSKEITLLDGIGAAIDSNWSASWALKESKYAGVDPDFIGQVKADAYKELAAGIPEEYQDALISSQSLEQMQQAAQIAKGQMENDRVLASFGWGGVGLNMAAAVLDPVAIGASLATEGAMAPVLAAAKLGRIGRIAASAFNAGVSNAAAEAAVGVFSPRVTPETITESFGIGMVLGGAFGALAKNPHLSDEAAAYVEQGQRMMGGEGSAGAMEVPGRRDQWVVGDLIDDLEKGSVSRSFMDWARPDVVARLSASGDDGARLIARYLAQEGAGLSGDEVVDVAATIKKKLLQHSSMHTLESDIKPSYGEWLQENRMRHNDDSWIAFNEEVTKFRDTYDPEARKAFPKQIAEANAAYDRFYDRFQKLANNPGAERGETLRPIPGLSEEKLNYRPMFSDTAAIHRIFKEIGESGMIKLVRQGIVDAVEDLEPELIDRMAKGYVTRLQQIGYGGGMGFDEVLSRGSKDELYAFLNEKIEDGGLEMSKEDATILAEKLYATHSMKDGKSPTSRGKRRTSINYNSTMEFNGKQYAVKDFFMKDMHTAAKRYADEMSGHVALGQMIVKHPKTGKVLVDGITTKGEWMKVVEQVKQRMINDGANPKLINETVERMQYLYDNITGKPRMGEKAAAAHYAWMRRAGKLQFMRLMQGMGIPQAQEFANIPTIVGLKAFIQGMPAFGRIMDKNRKPIPKARPKMEKWTEKVLNPNPRMIPKTEKWSQITVDHVPGIKDTQTPFEKPVLDKDGNPVMIPDPQDEWITTTVDRPVTDANGNQVMDYDYDPALGPYKDQVVQELMSVTGEGYDNYLHQFRYHHVDDAAGEAFGHNTLDKIGATFDKYAPKGQRIVANISLMRHVNTIIHQWAMRSIAQKIANLAFKHADNLKTGKFKLEDLNGFFTGKDADRFKLLGLDQKKTVLIFNEMLKKADGAAEGARLSKLNLDQWDPAARSAFVEALYQWTGRTIQSNDVGSLAMWMTHPMAQMMFQFRSFVFGAHAKQTLHGLRHMDGRTLANWSAQLMAAAGAWYLISKARSYGDAHPDKYMKEHTSWDMLAKAAVSRAGFTAVAPMFFDQAMNMGGANVLSTATGISKDKFKLDFRTSGTPTSGFMSVPILGHIDDLTLSMGSAADAVLSRRNLSQQEWNRLLRATVGNHLAFTTGLSYLTQDLPKKAPK
ncbi:hypothetical protein UFOVP149_31 [uncultured Caudovirales phage]|uniref:Uncharacterized protein n=1 Tax=uncultured Caudovirales phage TaxID=2100421 RepID=A0A6J7W7Z7_9CAUD|nr:hypothetical protein UFOVP149_31 [uncultured Caudovirales phage]